MEIYLLAIGSLGTRVLTHSHMVKRNRVLDGFGIVSFLLCLVSRLKPSNGGLKSKHGWNGAEEAAQLQKKNRYVFSIV